MSESKPVEVVVPVEGELGVGRGAPLLGFSPAVIGSHSEQ